MSRAVRAFVGAVAGVVVVLAAGCGAQEQATATVGQLLDAAPPAGYETTTCPAEYDVGSPACYLGTQTDAETVAGAFSSAMIDAGGVLTMTDCTNSGPSPTCTHTVGATDGSVGIGAVVDHDGPGTGTLVIAVEQREG